MRLHPTADDPSAQALVPQGTHDQAVVMVAFGLENSPSGASHERISLGGYNLLRDILLDGLGDRPSDWRVVMR